MNFYFLLTEFFFFSKKSIRQKKLIKKFWVGLNLEFLEELEKKFA